MVLDPKIKYIVFCKYYVVSAPVECKLVKLETSRTMIRWVFSAITITEIEKLPKPTTECSSVKIVFETVEIGRIRRLRLRRHAAANYFFAKFLCG